MNTETAHVRVCFKKATLFLEFSPWLRGHLELEPEAEDAHQGAVLGLALAHHLARDEEEEEEKEEEKKKKKNRKKLKKKKNEKK